MSLSNEVRNELIELFVHDAYGGDVYSMEPSWNGDYRLVCIKLIPPYPKSCFLQLTQLWKLWELYFIGNDFYEKADGSRDSECFLEYFGYFILNGDYDAEVSREDLHKALKILEKIQHSIDENPDQLRPTGDKVGVYLNDAYLSDIFPDALKTELVSISRGKFFDIGDSGFLAILEGREALMLSYWGWLDA